MASKYYWLKLQTDFFSQDTIDYLMSQPYGSQYVVIYEMLCLQTLNNHGIMATNFEDMMIPFDVNKIVRDVKYFDRNTVIVALGLYKKLGLVYEVYGSCLKVAGLEKMVGSASNNPTAKRKADYRLNKKFEVQQIGTNCGTKCPTEIDSRYKNSNSNKDRFNNSIIFPKGNYNKNVVAVFEKFGIDKSKWEELSTYTEQRILDVAAVVNSKKNVQNPSGLFISMLEKNWALPVSNEEMNAKKKEELQRYKKRASDFCLSCNKQNENEDLICSHDGMRLDRDTLKNVKCEYCEVV